MRTKSVWLTRAAVILFFSSQPALAQGNDDVIVITASRVPIAADAATSSISLLDAEALEARGAVFIGDMLRAVPGLAVSKSGPAGALTQIRARGSEANHTLVFIDGIEASSPFTGEADFAHMAFDDIDSIEVARGEQSALWGADAIGGVIHLTSALPAVGREAGFRFETGALGTTRMSGRLAAGSERGHLSVSVSGLETDGIDISGLSGERDGYSNRTGAFSSAYDVNEALTLEASVRWIDQITDSDADVNYDGRLNDTDNVRRGQQFFGHLGANADYQRGGVEWLHRAGIQLTDDAATNYVDDDRKSRSLGQRWQANYQTSILWGEGETRHRFTGLLEAERDRTKNDAGPGAFENQTRILETDAVALDYGLGHGALDVSVSARLEQNDRFEDATTWRIGAAWSFDNLDGRIRLSAGEGTKNPGVFELFGFFPAFFVGNPDLNPETSRGWELGWEQSFAGGSGQWSAVWFESTLQDEIYTDFGGFPATARNATTESQRRGLEVEASWDISSEVSVFGSVSLLESEQNGGSEIRRPERLGSLTLDWHPDGMNWSASLTADHTGDQRDTDFGTFLPVILERYTLLGGQLRWTVDEGMEIYVRGENLLDEDYQDVFGFNTPGRGLYFGLRLSHN
jgi:vitamin B12 transporter